MYFIQHVHQTHAYKPMDVFIATCPNVPGYRTHIDNVISSIQRRDIIFIMAFSKNILPTIATKILSKLF